MTWYMETSFFRFIMGLPITGLNCHHHRHQRMMNCPGVAGFVIIAWFIIFIMGGFVIMGGLCSLAARSFSSFSV